MYKQNESDANWVSTKRIYRVGLITLTFILLSFLVFVNIIIGTVAIFMALLLLFILFYFIYVRRQFSGKGKNIQNKIYDLLFEYINFTGKGKIIDIGCGEGTFICKMAKKYPDAEITGVDNWESVWGYSKEMCINKSKNEGFLERAHFENASASKLPFKDGTFDLAVSNFVFHEVKNEKNKKEIIKEALRVVKNGGTFVFQDMFLSKLIYGKQNDLLAEIKSWGISEIKLVDTSKSTFIPKGLKLPFITGNMAIIYGIK